MLNSIEFVASVKTSNEVAMAKISFDGIQVGIIYYNSYISIRLMIGK